MKSLNTLGKVLTKILEVFHWIGAALMIAATICSVVAPDLVKYFVGLDAKECCGTNLTVYGFEINIAIPIIGFVISIIARLVTGSEAAEISIDMSGILMGSIVLCLTQFFAHGVALENDVDGLL